MPSLECQFKESAIHLEGNWETSKDFEHGWGVAQTGSILQREPNLPRYVWHWAFHFWLLFEPPCPSCAQETLHFMHRGHPLNREGENVRYLLSPPPPPSI